MGSTSSSNQSVQAPVRVLFVRHGSREKNRNQTDRESPLAAEGRRQAKATAALLSEAGVEIGACYTSAYEHACETARLLPGRTAEPCVLDVLTPHESWVPKELFEQMEGALADRPAAFVGHEPRLSKLVAFLSGTRQKPLGPSEVVCVEGQSLEALRLGCGRIAWRVPVRAHAEEMLRSKVQSKMTVATFLAGFTFSALMAVVTGGGLPDLAGLAAAGSPAALLSAAAPFLAILLMVLAMILFVGAVYAYDTLSMPEGFWIRDARPEGRLGEKQIAELDEFGPVYTHMIRIWKRLFTPSVRLAAAGFVLFVGYAVDWRFAVVLVVAGLCVWPVVARSQPRLGID